LGENDGRFDFDDIVQRAICAEKDAALFHLVDKVAGFGGGGFQCVWVTYQFDADEEAEATYIADEGVVDL
jgi:hypothetical protein